MSDYSKSPLRSNLGRVRGLGSAKSGAHHWWIERLTSLALIPLTIWFLISLIGQLLVGTRETMAAWIANPLVALLLAALSFIGLLHAKMGVRVIVEDYVHKERTKIAALLLIDFIFYTALAGTLAAIARLHFIGI